MLLQITDNHFNLSFNRQNNNIIDVSYIKGLTDYKKFILDLADDSSVLKIIHPIKSIGTSGKISYDDGEPAIHIEITVKN